MKQQHQQLKQVLLQKKKKSVGFLPYRYYNNINSFPDTYTTQHTHTYKHQQSLKRIFEI